VLRAENILVGDCGITIQDIEREELHELAYYIKKEFRNMGYATEACRACINYAFGNLRYDSVCSYMRIDNYPSIRVA
jgi:RimJ/RimL family protein N-acetyltransferase